MMAMAGAVAPVAPPLFSGVSGTQYRLAPVLVARGGGGGPDNNDNADLLEDPKLTAARRSLVMMYCLTPAYSIGGGSSKRYAGSDFSFGGMGFIPDLALIILDYLPSPVPELYPLTLQDEAGSQTLTVNVRWNSTVYDLCQSLSNEHLRVTGFPIQPDVIRLKLQEDNVYLPISRLHIYAAHNPLTAMGVTPRSTLSYLTQAVPYQHPPPVVRAADRPRRRHHRFR